MYIVNWKTKAIGVEQHTINSFSDHLKCKKLEMIGKENWCSRKQTEVMKRMKFFFISICFFFAVSVYLLMIIMHGQKEPKSLTSYKTETKTKERMI